MTISPLSGRAADEFARALEDRALADPQVGRYVDLVDEIVEVGRSLPGPSPEFRDALWRRLSVLDVQESGTTRPVLESASAAVDRPAFGSPGARTWRRRLALSGLAAGILAGTALASTNALPGDALYGIKRTMEDVRLALTESDVAKGRRYLDIAETRLSEIQQLMQQDEITTSDSERIAGTFADMWDATQQGSELLLTSYERTHDRSTLVTLLVAVDRQRMRLGEIQLIAPADLQDETDEARSLLEEVTTDVLNRDPLADDLGDVTDDEAVEEETAEIVGCQPDESSTDGASTPCSYLAPDEVSKRLDSDVPTTMPEPTIRPGEVTSSAASPTAPADVPSPESSAPTDGPTATATDDDTDASTGDDADENTGDDSDENSGDDSAAENNADRSADGHAKGPADAKARESNGANPKANDDEVKLNAAKAKPTNPPGHDNSSADKADHTNNDQHRGRPQPPHTLAPQTVQISVPDTAPLSFPLDLILPASDATKGTDTTA